MGTRENELDCLQPHRWGKHMQSVVNGKMNKLFVKNEFRVFWKTS